MTKAEQTRLVAWRVKFLQCAADDAGACRTTCRHFGISRKTFYKWKRRHASTATRACATGRGRRTGRRAPRRARSSARSSISGSTITSAPAGSRTTCSASTSIVDRGVLGASHPDATRHASAAGESEAPAARQTLATLREAPARPPAADGREVPRANPWHAARLYQFTAIDDCTRIRVLKIFDACNQRTAIRFIDEVLRRLPFRVHVVQTDNGAEFQSQFHWHLEALDIRHVYIRPRTPHLNGKVERSHRVDDQEFYQLLDKDGISDDIHLFNEKLREWEDYYNYHRPHGALGGQTPYERLLAKTRAEVLPGS